MYLISLFFILLQILNGQACNGGCTTPKCSPTYVWNGFNCSRPSKEISQPLCPKGFVYDGIYACHLNDPSIPFPTFLVQELEMYPENKQEFSQQIIVATNQSLINTNQIQPNQLSSSQLNSRIQVKPLPLLQTSTYCPPGSSWTQSFFGCQKLIPICNFGMFWTGIVCFKSNTTACAIGYQFVDGTCKPVFSVKKNCSLGYYWNGLSCIFNKTSYTQCQINQYFNGLTCKAFSRSSQIICLSGSYFYSPSLTCLKIPFGATHCMKSQYWNGVNCTQFKNEYLCASGYLWNGNICVEYPFISTSCIPGKYYTGAQCADSIIYSGFNCKLNEYYNGTGCKQIERQKVTQVCNVGYYWNPIQKGCLNQQ